MNDRLFSYIELRDNDQSVIVFIHYDQIIEFKRQQCKAINYPAPKDDVLLYEFMAVHWAVEHY